MRGLRLAGWAVLGLALCTQNGSALESGIERAAQRIFTNDDTIPDPALYDGDNNGIADLAHFRLLDAVLANEEAPHYTLIVAVWSFNLLRLQVDNKDPGRCELLAITNGFICDDAIRTIVGYLTLAEPAAKDVAKALLAKVNITTDLQTYLSTAGPFLSAQSDLDDDGFSNLEEYSAVCGDPDKFVAACLDPAVTPETLPCCRNCPLEITQQPISARKYSGDSHAFNVSVTNVEGAVHYQWFHNGEPVGADSATLSFSFLLPGDSGEYWCEITDDRGVSGTARITSAHALLTVANHMTIQRPPTDVQRRTGESHTFEVGVSGGLGILHYQWYKDGRVIGADASSLLLTNLAESDAGLYWCAIRDDFEKLTTRKARLTVLAQSCYAEPCTATCSDTGISLLFEQALRTIDALSLVDQDPDTTDLDDNNIIDVAQARLVERILADPAQPAHCCVAEAYQNNLAVVNQIADQVPSIYFNLFIPRDVFVRAASGLTTVGETATLQIITNLTDYLSGFPPVDPDMFDSSAEQWLAYNGDADLDGIPNVSEFLAVVQGPQDFDAFVSAATDPALRQDGGGIEPCTGYMGILLAGDVWIKDAFRIGVFEDVLRAHGFGQYRVAGSTMAMTYATAVNWGKNENHELDRFLAAFRKYPDIEVVHLTLGAMDILELAGNTSLNSISSNTLNTKLKAMEDGLQKVVDFILAQKPSVRVLLADYDYLDPALIAAAYGDDMPLKPVSQRKFNDAMIALGQRKKAIADRTDRCDYVQNWGVLQYHLGNPPLWNPGETPLPGGPDAGYVPYPGGNPDYSSTAPAYDAQDGWRLTYQSHYWLFENAMTQFYAGVLTPEPEGEGSADGEGLFEGEGVLEGEGAAEGEGMLEGEGASEGEGVLEGEGAAEGEGSADGEGLFEGEGMLEGEGAAEGEGEGAIEGEGEGTPEPRLLITPAPGTLLDFGEIAIGTDAEITLKVENTGTERLDGRMWLADGKSIQTIGDGKFRLEPGKKRAISIKFSPGAVQLYTDVLWVEGGDVPVPYYILGKGVPKSLLSCSPESGGGPAKPWADMLIIALTAALLWRSSRRTLRH